MKVRNYNINFPQGQLLNDLLNFNGVCNGLSVFNNVFIEH